MHEAELIVDKLLQEDEAADAKAFILGITPSSDGEIQVYGNYGTLYVDISTGYVKRYQPLENEEPEYQDIVRVNIDELVDWLERNDVDTSVEPGDGIDIVNIGFWTKSGGYEEPEEEHRGITYLGHEP